MVKYEVLIKHENNAVSFSAQVVESENVKAQEVEIAEAVDKCVQAFIDRMKQLAKAMQKDSKGGV